MSGELICSWLRLPPGTWPPDHYALLGLANSEADRNVIEERVHQRMEWVRPYQLTHPELATEAMNRLAQALVCLTDPAAKKAYDAVLSQGQSSSAPSISAETFKPTDSFAWLLRELSRTQALNQAPPGTTPRQAEPATVFAEMKLPPLKPTSRQSAKRALYEYTRRTRRLLWSWEQAGRFLRDPVRAPNTSAEQTEFVGHLQAIRELLRDYLPVLGEVDQPGSLVLALARQPMVGVMLPTLLPSQRESLARDWMAGRALLQSYRQSLRQELRSLRPSSRRKRAVRRMRITLINQLDVLLLAGALLVLNLAFPPLWSWWWLEVFLLTVIFVAGVIWRRA